MSPAPPLPPSTKSDWRQKMKRLLNELRQDANLEAASAQILQTLRQHPLWKSSQIVALFAALPGEPNVVPLLRGASVNPDERGKQFVFPVIQAGRMIWRQCVSEEALLPAKPPLRLREPFQGLEMPVDAIDLMLVPGLAFTLAGERLGRGGGYYDRAIAERRSAGQKGHLGVCFSAQLVETLPTEAHDQKVEDVIHA